MNNASSEAWDTLETLLRAATLVRARLNEFLDPIGLTEGRLAVLSALAEAGASGLSQSELAEKLLQSESNISTLLDRMQGEGLVDRHRSEADRRKRVLTLSSAAECVLERAENSKEIWAARLLTGIPADDRPTLDELLKQLAVSLQEPGQARDDSSKDTVSESPWRPVPSANVEPNAPVETTPHVALEQMLASLGLNRYSVEEGQ